ncbi:hypothetical protein [Paraburkholderia strydomiana]|uniref:hypothetical protein n=1 Tax=Paraburkholderia strydomiana TaxID=1245417 RepID=UPI0038B7693B
MKRFVEGDDRKQVALLPECVDDYVGQDNPVRVIDAFVDELDLADLGFNGTTPALTAPAVLPSWRDAEDLYLRLSEPDTVEPET